MNMQCGFGLLPLQGATSSGMGTQGVAHIRSLALGWELDGLSDRLPFGMKYNKWLVRNDFGLTQRRKETPQRGSSTKPRASDQRERHLGWDDTPDGAMKGQKR